MMSQGQSAIARAEEIFRSNHKPEELFVARLALYMKHAFVLVTPTVFLMCRPVNRRAPLQHVVDPRITFKKPDAWYVDLAVGRLRYWPQLMPYRLPFMCFCRRGKDELKTYAMKTFLRRCE